SEQRIDARDVVTPSDRDLPTIGLPPADPAQVARPGEQTTDIVRPIRESVGRIVPRSLTMRRRRQPSDSIVGAGGGIRTPTEPILSRPPLPIGLHQRTSRASTSPSTAAHQVSARSTSWRFRHLVVRALLESVPLAIVE